MRPYGVSRDEANNNGILALGSKSSVGHRPGKGGDTSSPKSLRGGKRAATRRQFKRTARREGHLLISKWE